jgi:hypothetical protein
MRTTLPPLRGSVKIEVLDNAKIIYTTTNPNTLVLEAPKLLLAGLVPPTLHDSNSSFTYTSPRPELSTGAGGVFGRHTINYLELGYYTGATAPSVSAGATDLSLGSPDTVTKSLTSVALGEYSIDFICSFVVASGEETRKYLEAGLLSPALRASYDIYSGAPAPTDVVSYDAADQVLFAHQVHSEVQANVGNTIRYTWTITMQEPS